MPDLVLLVAVDVLQQRWSARAGSEFAVFLSFPPLKGRVREGSNSVDGLNSV
jgi:hypothetical protein